MKPRIDLLDELELPPEQEHDDDEGWQDDDGFDEGGC